MTDGRNLDLSGQDVEAMEIKAAIQAARDAYGSALSARRDYIVRRAADGDSPASIAKDLGDHTASVEATLYIESREGRL